ncbi:zinc-dependent dehydrogenase [Candidatus Margulisiibacteriota bacterium]
MPLFIKKQLQKKHKQFLMRVAKYYNNKDIRIEEIPKPKIGPGEILVKIMASGICGSDVMEWYRIKKAPLVLGHEIAGEIVGAGTRVAVSHHVPCNTCYYCLNGNHTCCETLHTTNFDPGGFSEFVRVPALNVDRGVFPLPDHVSYEEGSFVEPLACVVRGQRKARFKPGQTVVVMGSGISGLLHIMLAKARGAGKIIATDVNQFRLKAAQQFGADLVLAAKEVIQAKVKADLVIICTGNLLVFKQALTLVDRGGTVLFFAPTDPGVELPVPVNEFWRNGITLLPSYGNSPYDAAVALELIAAQRVPVKKMITHRLKLDETGQGFNLVEQAKDSLKVIIEPQKRG